MTARAIVVIAAALVCGAAACATPAGAAVFEFTLGSEPEVTLSSFELGLDHEPYFAVSARLDATTAKWVEDAATAKLFENAEVTVTSAQSVLTFDFSSVTAATASEETEGDAPTISAIFAYRAISGPVTAVPEPSTWAMLLLGAGGLAIGRHRASRRRRGSASLA
jgi:hypothetical protein